MSAAILPRLRAAGADVDLRDGRLFVSKASLVPPDLMAEAKARRSDLLAELENDNAAGVDHPFVIDPEERAAILAEAAMPAPPPPPPLAANDILVQRLADALMAPRPWQRVTDPEKARLYFQGEALRRLKRLDPLARGLLVSTEESEARRWQT